MITLTLTHILSNINIKGGDRWSDSPTGLFVSGHGLPNFSAERVMRQETLNNAKTRLTTMERDLGGNLEEQQRQYEADTSTDRTEPNEEAQVRTDSNTRGSLMYHDEERLVRVRSALTRIEEGTYGQCVSCGGPINEERLEAKPEAAFCIACERRREQER
jgi:DnaK suppressor protein